MKKKFCYIAKQYHKGWRLGMCIGNKCSYMDFWFKNIDDIKSVIKGNVHFCHLAEEPRD